MKFILEDKVPRFDFEFQLLASIQFWKWKSCEFEVIYENDKSSKNVDVKSYCPVGSLEFCKKHGLTTLPRNIPPQLVKYAVGTVTNDITSRMHDGIARWHVKSASLIKHPDNGIYSISNLPPFNDYQAVEFKDSGFDSEYRVFVYNGNIVDIQNYAGDLWTLPDKSTVEHMIYDFEHAPGFKAPPAYTLDVGIYDGRTCVVEVHDFYSCGTYNFNDHYHLPLMLWSTWNNLKTNII